MVNKSDFPRDNFDLLWMPAVCTKIQSRRNLDFDKLVIPIPGRMDRLYPPYYYLPPPHVLRPSAVSETYCSLLVTIRVLFIHKVQKAKNAIGIC